MGVVRTFVAVDLSVPVRRKLKPALDQWASEIVAVKWNRADQLHLTLKFLGDVDDFRLHDVCRAVSRGVASQRAFSTRCHQLGAFPHLQRPRIVWLGVDDPSGDWAALHQGVELEMAELDFPRELRPFRAHVTLGRVDIRHRRQEKLLEWLDREGSFDAGYWEVSTVTVYSSELTRSGPIYTPLARIPLHDS